MAPLLPRWGGVENTLRTRRFRRRLAKDPHVGKSSLLHHLIINIMDILNLCYLLADYERIFQEKPRRATIKTCWETVDESVVGATICRRGLELISVNDKLAKALYIVYVLFKSIQYKDRSS